MLSLFEGRQRRSHCILEEGSDLLDEDGEEAVLEENAQEEKAADEKLSKLAEASTRSRPQGRRWLRPAAENSRY